MASHVRAPRSRSASFQFQLQLLGCPQPLGRSAGWHSNPLRPVSSSLRGMPFPRSGRGVADDPGVRAHARDGRRGRVDVRARPPGHPGGRDRRRRRSRRRLADGAARPRADRARRRRRRRDRVGRTAGPLRRPGPGAEGPLRRAGSPGEDLRPSGTGRGRALRSRRELATAGPARARLLVQIRRSFGHADGPRPRHDSCRSRERHERQGADRAPGGERRRPLRPPPRRGDSRAVGRSRRPRSWSR